MGIERGDAWNCYGIGALWNRNRFIAGRLARRSVRAEAHVAVDWCPLHSRRGRICAGNERRSFHCRACHWWLGYRHIYGSGSNVYLRDRATQQTGLARRHVSVQHRFWHPDRFCLQHTYCWRWRACVALDVGCRRIPLTTLCRSLLLAPRESALVAEQKGRPAGRDGGLATDSTSCSRVCDC